MHLPVDGVLPPGYVPFVVETQRDPSDGATLRAARDRYFAANGLGEGGYTDRWVRLMAGPVPIWFPNTAARVRAVRLHDLHHVLTAYETTWTGEAELGAWEIASGCLAFSRAEGG